MLNARYLRGCKVNGGGGAQQIQPVSYTHLDVYKRQVQKIE